MLLSTAATSCGSPVARELLVRALVERQRLVEPVLAAQDVGDVAVETRQAERDPVSLEDQSRLPGRRERLLVPAEGDETLQRAVQRARHVHVPSRAPKQLHRRVVVFQGLVVLAADEPDVTGGSQALRPAAVVVELVGDPSRRVRQAVGPLQVDPRQPHDAGVQVFDDGRLPELRCAGEESSRARARC